MLCSICNKNTAVIFINKLENGKATTEGLCYNCAKEKGINPMDVISKNANLSEEDIANMTAQLDTLFKDFTENMNIDEMTDPNNIDNENNPLGGILGFFKSSSNKNEDKRLFYIIISKIRSAINTATTAPIATVSRDFLR